MIELDQRAAADGPIRILKVQGVQSTRRFALYQRRAGVLSPAMLALRDELLALIPEQPG